MLSKLASRTTLVLSSKLNGRAEWAALDEYTLTHNLLPLLGSHGSLFSYVRRIFSVNPRFFCEPPRAGCPPVWNISTIMRPLRCRTIILG